MSIQVPGAFLFAFSLWLRVGWEGWSTWLVYVVTGILQGGLLALGVTYFVRGRRRNQEEEYDGHGGVDDVNGAATDEDDEEEEEEAADERTALLENGQHKKGLPVRGTQQRSASQRQLSMLYAATPPEHDSDRSSSGRT